MSAFVALIYWSVVIGAAINFFNLTAGLLAAVTGRSHMPPFLRRLRRQQAATAEDQRVLGMSLTLLSVGQLLMMVVLLVVITLSVAQTTGGHAPIEGLYLVTLVAFIASVGCSFASFFIGGQARYEDVPRVDSGRPEIHTD
jgi:hypothetical protein